MRKIIISNNGLVTPEDIFYIGNSSKRGDDTKIGRFGSGWKYAIAWLMRNDCTPTIYSGLNKIEISTVSVVTNKSMFDAIYINGEKTSLTTSMGPDWKGWMAIRELYSNAIDEGAHSMKIDYSDPVPQEGKTIISIPANGELMDVLDHFAKYFCYDRKAAYGNEHGRVFVRAESGPMQVFRKGINCWDEDHWKTCLDFDFESIDINESRLTNIGSIDGKARKLLELCDNPIVLRAALRSPYHDILPRKITQQFTECIMDMVTEGTEFQSTTSIIPSDTAISIPKDWFIELIKCGVLENPIQELFRSLKHEFHPLPGHHLEEQQIAYHLSSFVKNPVVRVGHISSGYATIDYFAEGDKFMISEKYLKDNPKADMKELAANLLIAQRDILREYVLSKM